MRQGRVSARYRVVSCCWGRLPSPRGCWPSQPWRCSVGKGSYWWWGIGGTWFWIDPTNDLVMVGIIQRQGGVPGAVNHEDVAREAVSAALTAPAR